MHASFLYLALLKCLRNSSPKNVNLLKMYSPSGYLSQGLDEFVPSSKQTWIKCSITSLGSAMGPLQ